MDNYATGSVELREISNSIQSHKQMNNRHNQPRYRFDDKPINSPPQNETVEERIVRMLNTPQKTIKDNHAFLAALRATVAANRRIESQREFGI